MNKVSFFYDKFDKGRSNDSVEYRLWQNQKDDDKQNQKYTQLYHDLKLGKKFKQTFNSRENFIARLFEIYTHKLLRERNIETKMTSS